jgi:hypothetical protein
MGRGPKTLVPSESTFWDQLQDFLDRQLDTQISDRKKTWYQDLLPSWLRFLGLLKAWLWFPILSSYRKPLCDLLHWSRSQDFSGRFSRLLFPQANLY